MKLNVYFYVFTILFLVKYCIQANNKREGKHVQVLKEYNIFRNECIDLFQFEYDRQLENIHADSLAQRLIGIQDGIKLIYIVLDNFTIVEEFTIKNIEHESILKIMPKWEFHRVYLLAKQEDFSQYKTYNIYEVDLLLKIFVKLSTFNMSILQDDSLIQLIPNPFQG